MKKQKRQFNIKKIILSTIIFSGIILIIFNINFSFTKYNNLVFTNNVYSADTQVMGDSRTTSNTQMNHRTGDVEGMGGIIDELGHPITTMLYGILFTIAKLIGALLGIINYSLSPKFVDTLLSSDAIYTGWKIVRDTLNIMFVFFLLFSAFSTIFQVSRYHIKSTWVMIVVMALLVNFSWPITRVIIDFSNVTMDYVLNGESGNNISSGETVSSAGLMGRLSSTAGFFEIMIGENAFEGPNSNKLKDKNNTSILIVGIIIGAIFLFTIGAIAIMLLLRVILMAVLLVFASTGYVFAAFPSTRSISSKWWKALLDQAILGPVVLFALMLAVGVMDSINTVEGNAEMGQLQKLPQYAVAIILIWTGILAAKNISGQTAGIALSGANKVKGFAKNAGMKAGRFGVKSGDRMMAGGVNRMINKGGKIGKIGGGLATLRAMPDRAKNIKTRLDKKGENALEQTKAHGLNDSKWGGDKNALKNLEHKQFNEKVKKNEEKSTEALIKGLKTAEGTDLQAMVKVLEKRDEANVTKALAKKAETAKTDDLSVIVKSIEKKKDVGEDEMKSLAKVMHKLDDTMKKTVIKKATETGNAHIVADGMKNHLVSTGKTDAQARTEVHKMVYKNMNAEGLAKNKESLLRAASNPSGELYNDINQKLNRTGFARDFQRYVADNDTYNAATRINGTNL